MSWYEIANTRKYKEESKNAPGGNRTPDNPAPETGALSTELQTHNIPHHNNIFTDLNQYFFAFFVSYNVVLW